MDRIVCLTSFVRAVEAGSFAAASEVVGLTPAMVGRQIKWLEERLGSQLLVRTTRSQRLTEAGARLFDRAKALLDQLEAAEEEVSELRSQARGTLRVSAPVTLGSGWLPSVLPPLMAAHPGLRLELTLSNRHVSLLEDHFDAVIRVGARLDEGSRAVRLGDYRLAVCAAPAYLAAFGEPDRPEDLHRHRCLGFQPGASQEPWAFEVDGATVDLPIVACASVNDGRALRALALRGAGLIYQSEQLVADDLAQGRLVRVLARFAIPPKPVHVLYRMRDPLPLKLRLFIDHLKANWAAMPPAVG